MKKAKEYKTTYLNKDYEKIILIQEKIIKIKENEFKLIERLFNHYHDKSIEGWDWYARYWSEYRRIIKTIKEFDNNKTVKNLKAILARSKQGWLETHDVPDWFKKGGTDD